METALESPGPVPDTPTDADDGLYPCKGCGEILEEGKAFELAGNRWHIDCFRCNTCGTLLDSDANLLLLGDGSLICNNCTYSCSACGNKIEDLAILTGQEAFCAQCFKCRNCKKKIENLRYARTSQGIFCMQCHESLMARRRKKSRASGRAPSANSANSNPTVLDKSLPALPPGAVPAGALAEASNSPASFNSETPTERSPAMRQPVSMKSSDLRKETSAMGFDKLDDFKENLGFTDDRSGSHRLSHMSLHSNGSQGDDDNYIPVTLDTRPRPPPPFRTASNENRPHQQPVSNGSRERERERARDFGDLVAGSAPRSGSMERGQVSPHIMQQAMTRQPSTDRTTGLRRRNGSIKVGSPNLNDSNSNSPAERKPASPSSADTSEEQFILHDVPNKARRRSSGSKRGSKASNGHATSPNMTLAGQTEGSAVRQQETFFESPAPSLPSRNVSARRRSPLSRAPSGPTQDTLLRERPQRTDSLERSQKPVPNQAIPRKQLPRAETANAGQTQAAEAYPPEPSAHEPKGAPATAGKTLNDDTFEPPPRSSSRPTPTAGLSSAAMDARAGAHHDFTSPREAPQPPPNKHKPNESVSSIQSETFIVRDTGTPISHGPTYFIDAGAEDEFGRMGPEDGMDHGMFRKVSKVMRHGRSYSDKAGSSGSPRFPKSSRNGSIDISSPMIGSNENNDDSVQLRNKLRHSQQRIMELESEKNALQEQVNGAENIRQVNTELREKRSTMTFLDTQREMIMRELETMTDQLAKAKDAKGPVNIDAIKNDALRDFASQLQRLKESLSGQIESLMEQKNKLTDEITNLIQMKEKGNQEYESVQSKNQQLREHNAQLVASIQEMYRNQKQPPGNGLGISTVPATGIYNPNVTDKQGLATSLADDSTSDLKTSLGLDRSNNVSQISGETAISGEPARYVVEGPRVVDMRKGQPKKFSWKKGSENMAKNVKKGFKGAFASAQAPPTLREESFSEPVPYGQLQAGDAPTMGERPVGQRNGIEANRNPSAQAWGFLGQKGPNTSAPRSTSSSTMNQGAPPHELFGSDLSARCEHEGRVIPTIITRCIEEVELRGMDVEGIYRKSGSYSQIKLVNAGFEKETKFDISDEDLDIHAVTSAMKQYLRKLPMPLITYEAYDHLIGAAEAVPERGEGVLVEGCSKGISVLPEHHKNTLELLIGHLARVIERERENKVRFQTRVSN
ncbi:MAG: hypothetical protein Q9162_002529 [Coniocarpon cinnabarinum]